MSAPVPTPARVEPIGDELAIVWTDGAESYLKLADLRRLCPCAACAGEKDLLGRLAKPPSRPLTRESFQLAGHAPVGGYALQLFWADGHSDGLYMYERLREWGVNPPQLPPVSPLPLLPVR
jgi:DUF971 family protein